MKTMPDFELKKYEKQTDFSTKQVQNLDFNRNCSSTVILNESSNKELIFDNLKLDNLNQKLNSSLKMNSISKSSIFTSDHRDSTTIEIDSNLDLQKNNHLIEFNQLEDIFNFCNPRNTIEIKLKKGLRGLGISLCGGKQLQIDEQFKDDKDDNFLLINQLIRVKRLYPAQPASECGLIDENDFILDVNGHCLVGLTYIEAFNILHSVQDEVTLRIFKFNQCPLELKKYLLPKDENSLLFDNSSFQENIHNVFESTRLDDLDDENQSTNSRIRNVTLTKKDNSLGFTLSKIENSGFFIKQITKAPASLEKIYPGDRILSVNGTSLDGLDLNDAILFLRSLPDLCEFKLEQSIDFSNDQTDTTNTSLNYQSELEDDNRFTKKQLRYEVKIMLDSRNKNSLHNRLKRKELKKSKDETTKEQKIDRKIDQNEQFINSSQEESNCRLDDQEICDEIDKPKDFRSKHKESKLIESNRLLETNRFDKENYETFIQMNNSNEQCPKQTNTFFRQSSVIDFSSRNESRNQTNDCLNKQTNKFNILNKWRNQVMVLNDDEDDLNSISKLNQNSSNIQQQKIDQLKELNDDSIGFETDSMINRSQSNQTSSNQLTDNQSTTSNKIKSSSPVTASSTQTKNISCWSNQQDSIIQLNDIQLKMNANCMVNENSMYRHIENALFFYVLLDRNCWYGRIGFSLTDDQYNDYRIVNTIKHGFSACIVREIYPNSLAYSNGNIKIGDKLLEVNNQLMINKPVQTVIKELRKLKGCLRLLFVRKVF